MSKIGVGVGDEFPIDDSQSGPQNPPPPEGDAEAWRAWSHEQRAHWREFGRQQHDYWREHRHQWKDDWRAKKRAWREQRRAQFAQAFEGHHYRHQHPFHGAPHFALYALPALLILGVVMISIFIFQHIFVLFGLLVLGGLAFAYARGHHFDFAPDANPGTGAPRPPSPPTAPPRDAMN